MKAEFKYARQNVKYSHLTEIDFNSAYFQRNFETKRDYKAYEDSWFSIVQGIRNNPMLFNDVLYYSSHPYHDEYIVLYNHLCDDYEQLTQELRKLLIVLNKKGAIWKNADPQNKNALEKLGFRVRDEDYSWSVSAKFDDQTFPQRVCEIHEVLFGVYHGISQIRQQVRSLARKYPELEMVPYSSLYFSGCMELLGKTTSRICSHTHAEIKCTMEANEVYLYHTPPYTYAVLCGGKPVALIGFDIVDAYANFNCLIYDTSYKYITSYSMYNSIAILHSQGAKWVNLSGSEVEALDRWKLKFNPKYSIERTHAMFNI